MWRLASWSSRRWARMVLEVSFQRRDQRVDFLLRDSPHDLEINRPIVVRDPVAHSTNAFAWYARQIGFSRLVRRFAHAHHGLPHRSQNDRFGRIASHCSRVMGLLSRSKKTASASRPALNRPREETTSES